MWRRDDPCTSNRIIVQIIRMNMFSKCMIIRTMDTALVIVAMLHGNFTLYSFNFYRSGKGVSRVISTIAPTRFGPSYFIIKSLYT